MKGKILVTGGTGYIGSHTIVDLLQHGFEVISADNQSRSNAGMLDGIEKTASETIVLVNNIKTLMQEYKLLIRSKYVKMYSQDLLNNLFKYPYTKIEFIQSDLHVSRNTAIRYLEELVKAGILIKHKIGRDNFYENKALFKLLSKD
jgi:Fic family protein